MITPTNSIMRTKIRRLHLLGDDLWSNSPRWQTSIARVSTNVIARSNSFQVETLNRIEYAIARLLRQPLSTSAWDRMTFNDKVTYRRLRVRDPRYIEFSDKLRMRDYVSARLGDQCVPKLMKISDHAEAFSDLVGPFALKANHGSGWVIIVEEARTLTPEEIGTAQSWVLSDYGTAKREWAYSFARPLLYAEELLRPTPPPDYKVHVFSSIPKMIQIDTDRFEDHRRILMNPNWTPLGGLGYPVPSSIPAEPPNLGRMLAWGSALADGMDFVRVDLYDMGDRVLVGELTCYPGAGAERFRPSSLDSQMGREWATSPILEVGAKNRR